MRQLETERLLLRPFEEGDAEALFSYAKSQQFSFKCLGKPF